MNSFQKHTVYRLILLCALFHQKASALRVEALKELIETFMAYIHIFTVRLYADILSSQSFGNQ